MKLQIKYFAGVMKIIRGDVNVAPAAVPSLGSLIDLLSVPPGFLITHSYIEFVTFGSYPARMADGS